VGGGVGGVGGGGGRGGGGGGWRRVEALGVGFPFLLGAWGSERFRSARGRLRRHFRALELAAGVLLVGVGLLVMTDQLSALNSHFSFLEDLVVRLEEALL